MKLKKVMLMAALAAAIGSVNMVTAFADETASGETKYGWESDAKNNWRYYDKDGNLASGWIKSEEGDGRGNEVWYYIDREQLLRRDISQEEDITIPGRTYVSRRSSEQRRQKKMSVTTISAANIMRSETRTAHRISA